MLSKQHMSGYDIEKAVAESVANFWHESYGQIYPLLKQLTAQGCATSHVEKQEGKPERYVYTITDAGRAELSRWLSEPSEYLVERNELLLKLFFVERDHPLMPGQHVRQFRLLQERLLHRYEEIEHFLRTECEGDQHAQYQLMTTRFGSHRTRAMLAWCDETLATLRAQV